MTMYNVPTEGCNLEIMGYPFFAESVSPNEAFRRREYNFNALVGGTQKVTPGAYVGLDFSVVTHVFIDPERPDEHNQIFQEMMRGPVEVVSPELGGRFNAIVVIKPERDRLNSLKLNIAIKEVPDIKSQIPGEEFTVPASRKVDTKKESKQSNTKNSKNTKDSKSSFNIAGITDPKLQAKVNKFLKGFNSKKNSVPKKTKSNTKNASNKSKGK